MILYVMIIFHLFAFSLSPALMAIINPPMTIKSTAPVLTTTSKNFATVLRRSGIFPVPFVYFLVVGAMSFGLNLNVFFVSSDPPPAAADQAQPGAGGPTKSGLVGSQE